MNNQQTSRWLGFFLAAWLVSAGPAYTEESAPFVSYSEIVETAFPTSYMKRRYLNLTPAQKKNIDIMQAGILELIESTGPPWLSPFTAPAVATRQELSAVMRVIRESPIWVCKGSCDACGMNRLSACALSKEFGGSVASVILLGGCSIPGGNCARKEDRVSRKEFLQGLQSIYAQIAFAKINGAKDWSVMRPQVKAAEKTLADFIQRGAEMLDNCPASFGGSDLQLLQESGGLRKLPEAWQECGRKYLEPWLQETVPESCKKLISKKELSSIRELTIGRCDRWCSFLTCQEEEAPQPKLFSFGERWGLFLSENACDGKTPLMQVSFTQELMRKIKRRALTISEKKQLEQCTHDQALQAEKKPANAKPYEFPKGPEIRWVDE